MKFKVKIVSVSKPKTAKVVIGAFQGCPKNLKKRKY